MLLEENERSPAGNKIPQIPGFAILIADARSVPETIDVTLFHSVTRGSARGRSGLFTFSTFALAGTVRHKPSVMTYDLHRDMPLVRSRVLHKSYGNPDGATSVSAGGYLSNGRSASEWGGG